ncbi:hypothetical protein Ahy_B06g083670 [Arachis hypogaea]|uniref:Aminotransferase-like plant mobile domain-containing protein n=1 Tax=Arachis hypogaea TaxID=3818 RepID=A0A444YQB8_ARAHY|nr:hypothetical protein Ahy_B06g083670 [Arachis hypogaea]
MLGVLPPTNQIQKFAVNCSWFQETFGECPEGADEETVKRYARAYIMILLGTQLFADKSGNRIHIRWLPYMARLEDMGGYSWGSAALAWLYRCMCRVANRHVVKCSGHNPSASEKGPRVQMWRLRIDLLQAGDFIWMPYSSPDVLQVVHPEVLEPRHTALWRCGDRWFPYSFQFWHLHWESRADHVLRFDVVEDPGPSHDFLDWWVQLGKRFLSPEMPWRRVTLWGRDGGRRRGCGGRRRARAGVDDHGGHGEDDDDGDQHAAGGGDGGGHDGGGGGGIPTGIGGVSPHPGDLLTSDGLDVEFGGSNFLDEINAIMQEDDAERRRTQITGTQAHLDVDLNEPPSGPAHEYFALGGTPPSAYAGGVHSVAEPSTAPVHGESLPSGSSARPLPG